MEFNTRSPEQFEILYRNFDFTGKTVVNLGAGYGDISGAIWEAGAARVVSYDNDPHCVFVMNQKANQFKRRRTGDYSVHGVNILEVTRTNVYTPYDFGICFAVLPYFQERDVDQILDWLESNCRRVLLECQYAGDGPGFDFIKGDPQMRRWLNQRFGKVKRLGHTEVVGRDVFRTIWVCY